MRRVLVLLAFAGTGPACTSAAASIPASARAPSGAASSQVAAAPQPSASPNAGAGAGVRACRATPSTIYGAEAVVFEIDGDASPAPAPVELFDQQGRTLAQGQVAPPGQWRPNELPSGDFRLQAGSNRVSCAVTVNRELPRGSQAVR